MAPYTDALAHAIAEPVVETTVEPTEQVEPARTTPPPLPGSVQAPTVTALEPASEMATSMNVRITQKTADFQIPITATSNGKPVEFLRAGMRSAFGVEGALAADADQMALDFTDASSAPVDAVAVQPETMQIELEAAESQPSAEPVFQLEPPQDDAELAEIEIVEPVDPGSVELEEISRRFAPMRRGE